uniref:Ribosomal protein S4 n=1 Tax=Spumella sp. NIES-1846 TaxID=2490549 RepID=A0A455REG9_9STRA|nr:ribosomal protein S4 [Spumella sp. NIES-1846]
MSKYLGPKIRLIRKYGILPSLTVRSSKNRQNLPGEHNEEINYNTIQTTIFDEYKEHLIEKQKLRFNYCLTDNDIQHYYYKLKTLKNSQKRFLNYIEFRLDCLLYRLGFAKTILQARQYINHNHILVNNKIINLPNYICNLYDIISINKLKKNSKKVVYITYLNIKNQRQKLLQNIQDKKLFKYKVQKLLPSYLEIHEESANLYGCIINYFNYKEALVHIDELKILQLYSLY